MNEDEIIEKYVNQCMHCTQNSFHIMNMKRLVLHVDRTL